MKEKIGEAFRLYFILFTLISILLMILGMMVDSDRKFGYEVFVSPLVYAAIGVIPVFLFNDDKEVSMKGIIIRRIIQLLLVEAAVLVIAFSSKNVDTDKMAVVVGIAVGVAVVFILSLLVEYMFELSMSRKLNEALEMYQKRN